MEAAILTDEKPKYLNTSDTLVFHKSNSLFALNFAKNENSEQLILAEGYMDVIALHQAGFRTAVATLGTALTSEQARIMAKYAREVVVCYDADEAGQKATARAIPLLRDAGLNVKVSPFPTGKIRMNSSVPGEIRAMPLSAAFGFHWKRRRI